MSSETTTVAADESNQDFARAIKFLGKYSEAANKLAELQSRIDASVLEISKSHQREYTEIQKAITESEAQLEALARSHPDWFLDRKSLVTPLGTIKFHASTKLEVPNEELTIMLIEQEAANPMSSLPSDALNLIRQQKTIDLEQLEKLDDATLKRLRVRRVRSDKFSCVPKSIDLGKAIKAQKSEAA